MIKAEGISRSVNSKKLFKNISFELPNNKITGLLGANGAGKTSLFKALAGLTKIDDGKLSFFWREPELYEPRGKIKCWFKLCPSRKFSF